MSEKEKTLYLCNKKACGGYCPNSECFLTRDKSYAKTDRPVTFNGVDFIWADTLEPVTEQGMDEVTR